MKRCFALAVPSLMLVLALAACSDPAPVPPPPDRGVPDTRAPDAGPQPDKALPDKGPAPDQAIANGPLTITVYKSDPFTWDTSKTPFPGATVAFDLPDGKRLELTTGADGKATVSDVAWSKGTVNATGHAKGMRPISYLGIRKQDGDQELWLLPLKPAWVPVSGAAAKNMDAAAKYWAGGPTVSSQPMSYGVGTYATGVPSGVPFSLIGMQYDVDNATASPRDRLFKIAGWCKADSPAITTATTLDIDCAVKQPVTAFKATITLPTDPKSLLRTSTTGLVFVSDFDSALTSFLGYASKATIAADGKSFNLEAEHVSLAAFKAPLTQYVLSLGAYQGSVVASEGAPKDGTTVSGFLEQATLLQPAKPTTAMAFGDPIEWSTTETGVRTVIALSRGNLQAQNLEQVWFLWAMPGTTKLTLPEPPSTVDVAELLGSDPIYGQVNLCEFDLAKLYCKRNVGGKLFKLQPPPPTCSPDKWCIVKTGLSKMPFTAIWGSGASDLFLGGGGKIAHYDGASFTVMSTPSSIAVRSFWGSGPKDVFAVGDGGAILHYDGAAWSAMTSGTTENLARVWGSGAKDVFVAGAKGTILRYDGTSWKAMTSGTAVNLAGLWGTSATEVFAAGSGGTILRYDGTAWSAMTSGTSEELRALWGTGAKDLWAASGSVFGSGPGLLHYDGSAWSVALTSKNTAYGSIWGPDAKLVFAAGVAVGPALLRFDGTSWAPMDLGIKSGFPTGVWGPSANEVYVAVDTMTGDGLLLRYKP